MNPNNEIQALRMILEVVMEGHPHRKLALTQIDGLIAEMQVNCEGSAQLQAADPLREAVEKIRAEMS